MRRYVILSALVLTSAGCVYILATRIFVSEEARVRNQIERGRKAIVNESLLTISTLVDRDYRDRYGRTREELLAAARSFFQHAEGLDIKILSERVTVENSQAQAYVRFTISGTLDGRRFEGLGSERYEEIWLRFAKKQGPWKLVESSRVERM